MLPVIILICDVFRVSLPEQDTISKGRMYKNLIRYLKILLLCYVRECYKVYKNVVQSLVIERLLSLF